MVNMVYSERGNTLILSHRGTAATSFLPATRPSIVTAFPPSLVDPSDELVDFRLIGPQVMVLIEEAAELRRRQGGRWRRGGLPEQPGQALLRRRPFRQGRVGR